MTVSALKRKTEPRNGLDYYLAISHGYDQHGWRLRPVPSNYELRYVCKKGSSIDVNVFCRRFCDRLAKLRVVNTNDVRSVARIRT